MADPPNDRTLQQETLRTLKHHVRTPMATIQGMAQLLNDEPDMLPDERLSFVQIIQRESARLAAMTEDVLVLAHAWKSEKLTGHAECSVHEVFEKLTRFGVPSRKSYKTRFDIKTPPSTISQTLHTDTNTIVFLILKMIDFCLSYVPESGTIEVDACVEGKAPQTDADTPHLRVRVSCRELLLDVAAKESLEKSFTEPHRHAPSCRQVPEIGLGPYIAREVAEQLGWHIHMHYDGNEGLCLWLDMPR